MPPLPGGFLIPEGRVVRDITFGDALLAYCLTVISICSHLLKEEASLMIAERVPDLWVQQIVIRTRFITLSS